jgi:hypothetical protein
MGPSGAKAKTPGLTLVGVLGMSAAVTIGALAFAAVNTVTAKALGHQ